MIKDIIKSLLLTILVALFFTACGYYIFNLDILNTFVCSILVQIIVFYLWNSILGAVVRINLEKQETQRIEQYEKQGVDVSCAHCNAMNFIPIRVNDENSFNCTQCDKPNSVYVDITVAQKADLIGRDSLSIETYIKDKVDAANKLK